MASNFCKRCGCEIILRTGKQGRQRVFCADCKKTVEKERWTSERTKVLQRTRYAKDPVRFSEKNKRWQKSNPEKFSASIKKWVVNNHDKFRGIVKAWQSKNHDKVMQNVKNSNHKRREQKKSINSLTAAEWRQIQEDYHHKCVYCGTGGRMTMEHIVPLSKSGTHTANNVVPACLDCNRKKNRKSLLVFLYQRLMA